MILGWTGILVIIWGFLFKYLVLDNDDPYVDQTRPMIAIATYIIVDFIAVTYQLQSYKEVLSGLSMIQARTVNTNQPTATQDSIPSTVSIAPSQVTLEDGYTKAPSTPEERNVQTSSPLEDGYVHAPS